MPARAFGLGGGAQRVRDSREILDGPVVEVGRDATPLVGGRLDGALEERRTILLRPLQPPAEAPRERHLDEPEQHEAAEQEHGERQPDPPSGRGDLAPALVGLEQEQSAVRRPHGDVDLVQVALTALEAVLRPREVAELGAGRSRSQHLALRGIERVARADEARLVRVDDAAVASHSLTRTTRSPSTRSLTIRSTASTAATFRSRSPGSIAGSTIPWPARTANWRASRSASSSARLRRASSAAAPNTASTTRPASANCATGRLTGAIEAYDQGLIVARTGAGARCRSSATHSEEEL